ncbi:MAG TPA: protein-glutamate O-methyltransferase CheR [Nitrospiria bacterium]|nr:protein-glutamate O-methyltransferase CheR [Nitrospiria bacterium]
MRISQADFDFIRQLVREETGIVLGEEKSYLAETRLNQLAGQEGYASAAVLVKALRNGQRRAAICSKAVEALTISETLFFRDFHPFEALRKLVLPDLLAQRAAERRLNIWSAACATGQEPYSVAMLLKEEAHKLTNWTVSILASDLSTSNLEQAKRGRFSQIAVNRGLPAAMLIKYFTQEGTTWILKEEIRRMIEFRRINLVDTLPILPAMDIIFLRNVLIYFDIETRKAILTKIRRQLRPNGYLFLGASETMLQLDESYERVPFKHGALFRLRAP